MFKTCLLIFYHIYNNTSLHHLFCQRAQEMTEQNIHIEEEDEKEDEEEQEEHGKEDEQSAGAETVRM